MSGRASRTPSRQRQSLAAASGMFVLSVVWCVPRATTAQPSPAVQRADGIAAIVGATSPEPGATVIFHSDVDLRARLRLAGAQVGELPLGRLPPELVDATLEELIGEALIAREADRVHVSAPTDADIRNERSRIERLAGGRDRALALLRALGASESELDQAAQTRAKVKVFLDANLDGRRPDDAQVSQAFDAGEHPFIGQELEDVMEAMRVWMMRRQASSAVTRWIEVLRDRTPVHRP